MAMITIINGTNRHNGNSLKVAKCYLEMLKKKGAECQLFALENLPADLLHAEMYGKRSVEFEAVIDRNIKHVRRFVFIIPEYNGGFPGVLKAFIDCFHPSYLYGKKAALVGVSAGHAGAAIPMAHFTDILHYLSVEVLSRKPKLSGIDHLLDDNDEITHANALRQLEEQMDLFLKF